MKLTPISAGSFHCDGGALFSVIPKVLWGKAIKADENNFVKLSMDCLLVETGQKKILIETGAGNHYTEKFCQNNDLVPGNHLSASLKNAGYHPDEITDVLFTHLHWDHCNGAVKNTHGKLELVFPNAWHWCSLKQWEHSKISNKREQAAYYPDLLNFLFDSGKLDFVEKEGELFPNIHVRFYDGHTPGMMIPFIKYQGKTVVYMSDLIPTAANIPLVWVAAYDLFPVTTLKEKEQFLDEAVKNNYILYFEHDPNTECAIVKSGGRGFIANNKFKLAQLHNENIFKT